MLWRYLKGVLAGFAWLFKIDPLLALLCGLILGAFLALFI